MSEQALSDGNQAFKRGQARSANPFDPSGEDWMCWRDGFDQAKAAAERAARSGTEAAATPPGAAGPA